MRRERVLLAIMALAGAMLACTLPPGVPVTPTLIPTYTPSLTAVALLPTQTATPLPTLTLTPSDTASSLPSMTATPIPSATLTDTPTATLTPLPSQTDLPTATFTASSTSSPMPSDTPLPTATLTPTFTPRPTNTALPTATQTPLPSATLTASPTNTLRPTLTATRASTITPLPTMTYTPSRTNTAVPTLTFTPTLTPIPSLISTPLPTLMLIPLPTLTPIPSLTATPLPTITPSPFPITATPFPTLTPTAILTATLIPTSTATVTLTPPPTQPLIVQPSQLPTRTLIALQPTTIPVVRASLVPSPTVIRTAPPTFRPPPAVTVGVVNTQAPRAPTSAPLIGGIPATITAISGTRAPTAAFYATGTNGPVIQDGGGVYTVPTPPAGLSYYAVNPQTGQVAVIDTTGYLYIGSQPFVLSPMSQFGLGNFKVRRVAWSPNGRLLAFNVERPDARDGRFSFLETIDDGLWVYDPAANQSRQVFRNGYPKTSPTVNIVNAFLWGNDSLNLVLYLSPESHDPLLVINSGININLH